MSAAPRPSVKAGAPGQSPLTGGPAKPSRPISRCGRPARTTHLFLIKFKLGIGPRSIELAVAKYLNHSGFSAW